MKNLFLLLLLGNLLFWGWRTWVVPPEVPALELRTPGKEPRIVLLGPVPAAPASGAGSNSVVGTGSCVRLGPIALEHLAEKLRNRLLTSGFVPTLAEESGQIWFGYWVQLEAGATREEADSVVARLAAGGLPDANVSSTVPPFQVSLGVFRDRKLADTMAAKATGLGFRPKISDRYRAGTEYWLTMRLPAGRRLSLEELGRETGEILRSEPVACP